MSALSRIHLLFLASSFLLVGSLVSAASQTLTQGATVSASSTSVAPSSALATTTSRKATSLPGTASLDTIPTAGSTLPQVFAPTRPRTTYTRYPWKRNIMATVFWVGEKPSPRNPTPNNKSSWDMRWEQNFGGYDNPKARNGYKPVGVSNPGQNPFYIALPYNDVAKGNRTKSSAHENIPWFRKHFVRAGRTVLKGRWLAIRRGSKVCYAQWEDVGPFETDNWEYVFGDERPKTRKNGGAGLDVSPAVRDYLGMRTNGVCDWRFVDIEEVPDGPWKTWGANNPFVKMRDRKSDSPVERIVKLRELRDEYVKKAEEE